MNDEVHLLHLALHLAATCYHNVDDRYGRPKLLHVIRVSQRLPRLRDQIAGMLHDLPEDDEAYDLDRLRREGFPHDIIHTVDCVTRRDGKKEPWENYYQRIESSPAAIRVKLADLQDNMDLLRTRNIPVKDLDRYNRYLLAFDRLLAAQQRHDIA